MLRRTIYLFRLRLQLVPVNITFLNENLIVFVYIYTRIYKISDFCFDLFRTKNVTLNFVTYKL